jgi:large subunit ribosomal protein L15
MKIQDITPNAGSSKKCKRVGRGMGSGHGKTSTKGHKGQKARSGHGKGPGFEGGQTPLQRRLPKRGFSNCPFKVEYSVINLGDLDKLEGIDVITPEILIEKNMVKNVKYGIKILGNGSISRPVTVEAHAFSETAIEKIKAAGGKAEVL